MGNKNAYCTGKKYNVTPPSHIAEVRNYVQRMMVNDGCREEELKAGTPTV